MHATHHSRAKSGLFEPNDVFGVFNMLLIIPLMCWAWLAPPTFHSTATFGFTVGVSAFGTGYMVIHDGVVHRRFWTGRLGELGWIRRVAKAHEVHHSSAEMGPPYGMFLGPHELSAAAAGKEPEPMPLSLKVALSCCAAVAAVSVCIRGAS